MGVKQILHRDRNTVQDTARSRSTSLGVQFSSPFQSLGIQGDDAVQFGPLLIIGLDSIQIELHQLTAGEGARIKRDMDIGNRRLLEPLGYVPPAEYEEEYYRSQEAQAEVAGVK